MASGTALVSEKRRRNQPIVLKRQSPSCQKLTVTQTKRRFHRRRSPGSPLALALSSPASPSLAKTNLAPSTRDEQQRGSYWITTFGCQMNKADSERMAGILETMGYREANAELDADLVLYNTCTIRDNAEQKVYSYLAVSYTHLTLPTSYAV